MHQTMVSLSLQAPTSRKRMHPSSIGECSPRYMAAKSWMYSCDRDPRNPAAPLRTHGSTHSDDITAVHFGRTPSNATMLFSASTDGLISISDAKEGDEDEAVIHVGNWGCSISQGGWIYDSKKPHLWTASDMETFGYWSNEVCTESTSDVRLYLETCQLDKLQDTDIRQPSWQDRGQTWVTDYLIGCHCSHRVESGLAVFVGSNELARFFLAYLHICSCRLCRGDAALITNGDLTRPDAPWAIQSIWTGGHAGIVRSILWDEDVSTRPHMSCWSFSFFKQNNVLVTGGEDSKILTWRGPQFGTREDDGDTMQVDSPKVKREWQDTMDISELGAVSHLLVVNTPSFLMCLKAGKRMRY